jgi:hypothetical protein
MATFDQVKSTLEATIAVANNNAPINEAEGNEEQAALERQTAEECRAAINLIDIDKELAELEVEMRDTKSDYFKGRLAPVKQERYRELVALKEKILEKK